MDIEKSANPEKVYKNPNWAERKKQLKMNRNQRTTKSIKNIKSIDTPSDPNFNYCSIEVGPSATKAPPKYCDITGYETKYKDSVSGLYFYDKNVSSYIKMLSKPVTQQFLMIRGVVPIDQPTPFWKYTRFTQQQLDKTDNFINTFQNELKALIDPEKHILQNYEILVQKIGTDVHPCLVYKQKPESNYPQLKSTDYGENYIVFLNHKIDAVTLKLLTFLTTHYKINTIKFSSNDLAHQLPDVKKLIEKQDTLSSLYFQWNPLLQVDGRAEFFSSLILSSLQHLILRECEMGNEITSALLTKILSNTANNLSSLDLYGNKLTNDIGSQIVKFIEESKKLEFIGLSKNDLNSHQFLKNLFNSIGQIPLSEEQYQQYKVKEKQRDEVVERNKKRKKGVPEEPVPFLFDIKQTDKGRFYVKNLTLKVLNLSGNEIKDSINKESNVQLFKNFAQNQGKHVELFIEGNNFTKKSKQMFKFYQNIYF